MANEMVDGDATLEKKRKASSLLQQQVSECPYLDTIQRTLLDFDFEPACSVSLEGGPHIYACLVCGKFFRGRGRHTPATTHAVEESHFVFVHLSKGTFHCLPDDYEIVDPSLSDIKAALHPQFTPTKIQGIDSNTNLSRDLFGRKYLPGFVGLNNHNKTDCINAVVQALVHVTPIRNYFLSRHHLDSVAAAAPSSEKNTTGKASATTKTARKTKNYSAIRTALLVTRAFGELVRKIWSDQRFKSTVDPHVLVQAISEASKTRFKVGVQAEAGELMAWLLHQLHLGTGGGKQPGSSIIHQTFQGYVEVTVKEATKVNTQPKKVDVDDRLGSGDEAEEEEEEAKAEEDPRDKVVVKETTQKTHFLQLTLDIPEKPLFRDEAGGLVIPQEPLVNVLKKFDGSTFSEAVGRKGQAQRKRYRLLKLPDYLILHLDRFKSNNYSREKNPTIVAFPVKNLDLRKYVFSQQQGQRDDDEIPTEEQIRAMSVKQIKSLLTQFGREDLFKGAVEKEELQKAAVDFAVQTLPALLAQKYDLVANITHESSLTVGREEKADPLQEGSYKCHVHHRATNQWYEIQDLHVQEIMAQQIGVSESYVLVFRRTGLE